MNLTTKQKLNIVNDVVELYFNVDPKTLTRKRSIRIPRQISMYLMYKNTKTPLTAIGLYYKRTHATVINARQRVEDIIDSRSRSDDYYKKSIIQMQKHVDDRLNLTHKQVQRINALESILEIINDYNILALNNLKNSLILMPK